MGHCHNVAFVVWGADASLPLIKEYGKLLTQLAETHGPFSIVHVVPAARPLPNTEVRAAFASLGKRFATQLTVSAVLIVGGGFWASAVRSLITSMQVLVQQRFRAKICGSVEEVATWLAPVHSAETNQQIEPEQLRAAIQWMVDHPSVRGYRVASSSSSPPR